MKDTFSAWLYGRPWGLALLWLCLLVPMFFGTYIGALEVVSWREHVPTIVFEWERHVPFLAWTVIPYWSIDLFYGLSLFLCESKAELNRHALRLVTAQGIAIPIFLAFPLRLTSTIPEETGIYEPLFAALGDMVGKPYNLAPSLHIALLVILWVRYLARVPRWLHWIVHVWASLIGVSVLTAYQHHFFDVPTGAMLGFFCLWVWPERGASPLSAISLPRDIARGRLAAVYGLGGLGLFALAWQLHGAALWLLWPSQSLLLVALAYGLLGEAVFQKDPRGRMSLAARWLLWPYLLGARLNAALWARQIPGSALLHRSVWLGRLPSQREIAALAALPGGDGGVTIVDLTAELEAVAGSALWVSLPSLDLLPIPPERLSAAVRRIEEATFARPGQPVLVCCALGLSRSAAVAATWLVSSGFAPDVPSAVAYLAKIRPQIVLGEPDLRCIDEAARLLAQAPMERVPSLAEPN